MSPERCAKSRLISAGNTTLQVPMAAPMMAEPAKHEQRAEDDPLDAEAVGQARRDRRRDPEEQDGQGGE